MYTNTCKHCRMVFRSRIKSYCCSQCKALDDLQFERIIQYLENYPNSNVLQISDALGILAPTVLDYVKEGRLLVSKGIFEQL